MLLKKWIIAITSIVICMPFGTIKAKSVFIVSKNSNPSKAEAFNLNSDQVDYQDTIDISTFNSGAGAVGIAAVLLFNAPFA